METQKDGLVAVAGRHLTIQMMRLLGIVGIYIVRSCI